MANARLGQIGLPDFGMPQDCPQVPAGIYAARLDRLRRRLAGHRYHRFVVYADREHSAGISYLTGFDPRFEEAILVVGPSRVPAILVGNECRAMAEQAPLEMRAILFQELSLPGQPRDRSASLTEILTDEGIGHGSRVGIIGSKSFASRADIDAPAYLVDEIRRLVGPSGVVESASDVLNDSQDGMRVVNEVEQLAAFEYSACQTSDGVRRVIFGLEPGMPESEAVRLLRWNGMPLSCHLMLTAGPRAALGLMSPSDRQIQRGDQFTVAFGIWGALNCRAGFVVSGAHELAPGISDYVGRLVGPYFEAIAEWYEALHVGQSGGVLADIVHRHLGDPFFGVSLNPGHQIHLDEWVNSPMARGSEVKLRSGMALQVDVIPATGTGYFTTNIEDGVALADEALRDAFAAAYPGAWHRIQARRTFMKDALGIALHPDVLPFSNIPAYLPPLLLRPDSAMTLD